MYGITIVFLHCNVAGEIETWAEPAGYLDKNVLSSSWIDIYSDQSSWFTPNWMARDNVNIGILPYFEGFIADYNWIEFWIIL